MIVFHYEIIEKIFGTYVANHFDEIWTVLMIIGMFAVILSKKSNKTPKNRHKERNWNKRKWYPSGWVFNEETQLWEPPDYVSDQSKDKWRWDEKKQIWIDQEKEARQERYHEFRKSQGKEPTYEEWKAAREAERQSDTESSN